MVKKIGRLGILAALMAVLLVAMGWLFFFYTEVGMAKTIGVPEPRLSESEYSSLPQSVIEDANRSAREMFGSSQDSCQGLMNQLLAAYVAARDNDVVVVFNSGGWGSGLIDKTPGWCSILDGIKSKLDDLGYQSRVLNYQRTGSGLRAHINEFKEAAVRYPLKARELARQVQFLTDHIPNLGVIIAGESNGTVIADSAMRILQDNPQVYSIQTGTPFWHKPTSLDRTLLMNSNGRTIDTFSYGKVSTVIWTTVKGWFGLSSAAEHPGRILSWLRAPGHDYSWQYPGVCAEVVKFLGKNFAVRK